MIPIWRLTLLAMAVFGLSACGKFIYVVDLHNHGRNGVLLLQIGDVVAQYPHSYYSKAGVPFPIIRGLYPTLPSRYRDPPASFGRFRGYDRSIPDTVEIVWQLADLKECRYDSGPRSGKTKKELTQRGLDPSQFVNRYGCTWAPLTEKKFRKNVDLREIRESDAYAKTGERDPESSGRFTLIVSLVFAEDDLRVEVANGVTNPWR